MYIHSTQGIFIIAILFIIAAAIAAVIFSKNHKASNIISNILCMAGSVVGVFAALQYILRANSLCTLVQLVSNLPFIEIQMSLDKLSAYFLMALFILTFAVSLYSIGYISHYYGKRNVGLFNFLYSTFILSMIMVITAGNTVTFFIAWEIMSVGSYFLVVFESEKRENCKAGTVYIIMTHIGAALLLISFMVMYTYTGTLHIMAGAEMTTIYAAVPQIAKNIIFIFMLAGFGTKAGIIPFHIWLPKAHPAASSNISALMSGFMIKTAVYGIVRFILCCFGVEDTWWGIVILVFGIVAAVLGVAYALMEHNIKRLLAFHSIENIGIIFIGIGISFIAFSQQSFFVAGLALVAALFHTLNHALFKGGLFLGAGAIQYSTHTKDIEQLGGLIKRMPYTAVFVLCFSLAISAIVPFNGFVSEWLTYQAIFAGITIGSAGINILSLIAAAALAFAGALAAVCFVKLFGISFLGLPRSEAAKDAKEVPVSMLLGMGVLAAFCLILGLFPRIILKVLDSVLINITGLTITDQLTGSIIPVFKGLEISGNNISMLALFITIAVIIIVVMVAVRIVGGKVCSRTFGTWDCGFIKVNERMQYSATGFSKPIRIVFRILYRPSRKLVMTGEDAPYFPDEMEYKVSTTPVFEKYLYNPVIKRLQRFSQRVKLSVQTGSIHMYLFYILLTAFLLMLYSRFF